MVLQEVGENIDEQEVNLFFDVADSDGDGQINYYEFSKIMKGK